MLGFIKGLLAEYPTATFDIFWVNQHLRGVNIRMIDETGFVYDDSDGNRFMTPWSNVTQIALARG